MENVSMRTFMGLSGYSLIIVGAFFIDTPILSLLAIPIFLAGTVILMLFYDKIIKKHNKLGLIGILIICLTLGYACVEFNQFLVLLSSNDISDVNNIGWAKIMVVLVLVLLSAYLVYYSLGKENVLRNKSSMFGWWLSETLLIPFVLLLYWIAYKTGNWMGG